MSEARKKTRQAEDTARATIKEAMRLLEALAGIEVLESEVGGFRLRELEALEDVRVGLEAAVKAVASARSLAVGVASAVKNG